MLRLLRLLRLYLNYFCSLLSQIELKEKQKIFFRQQIWIFAADLMHGFCLNIKFEYFNNLFVSMKIPGSYTSTCYKIVNDRPDFIDLT